MTLRFFSGVLLATLFSTPVLACQFPPGYATFAISTTKLPDTGDAPAKPTISAVSLRRGTDDGNYASCSDAGVITFELEEGDTAKRGGYVFEVQSGDFPEHVLPDVAVSPIELENGSWGFYFVWLDLPAGRKSVDQIDAKISVRAVSSTMVEGDETVLTVRDP